MVSSETEKLNNGKDIRETGYLKDFHDGLVDMGQGHRSLFGHGLLCGKQYTQTGG